jgi:hypothetical protein
MDGSRDHHVEQGKSSSEKQLSYVFTHMWNPNLKKETQYMKYHELFVRTPQW